jgi:hypothetical protein
VTQAPPDIPQESAEGLKCPHCKYVVAADKKKPQVSLSNHIRYIHERDRLPVEITIDGLGTATEPVIWTGEEAVAPEKLPRNLAATVPAPFPFAWLAIFHHPLPLVLLMSLSITTAYEFVFIRPHLPYLWSLIVPLILIPITVVWPAMIAPKKATRKVIVIRRDVTGRTEVDEQLWWGHECAKWSDAWRWIFEHGKTGKRRVMIIDAQDYNYAKPDKATLHPFAPWRARLPIRPVDLDKSVVMDESSPADLGMVYAKGIALREWLDVRDPTAERLNQAMLCILIGVAFLAIYLGGDKVATIVKERPAQVQAAVQQQVQAELQALLQTGQFLPATPVPTPAP